MSKIVSKTVSKIVYGKAQGGIYNIVKSGMYKGIKWEIGNNRGTYPFATIFVNPRGLGVWLPTAVHAEEVDSFTWCYADEGDRLGDYRDGKAWTFDEIFSHIKDVINQIEYLRTV